MSVRFKQRRTGGFTLVELMVTIVVASILLSIAVPAYQAQVRKSRRTEARMALMDLATREERYYSVNNDYSNSALQLGYGTDDAQIKDRTVGNGYYQVTVDSTLAKPPQRAGFTITAKAFGTQSKDAPCQTFAVDQSGTQSSTPSTTDCWN
ncbi:MAG: type pilus assembly protein PilE [Gammaproteobacteria bacterium]|jgi:type IV pilus assembly protein PilE|nr:type pilus assembly protein PilE [Gammaproteobacteria bacterium]